MNSMEFDVIKSLVENKKYSAITEYSRIVNPSREDIIVTEYTGSDVTVYKDDRGNVRLLCPKNMDYVTEGHVAQAISNGTIFDDATDVDNNATMIERTSLPYDAMINSGKPTPKHLKPMIAIIIGKMDHDGSCAVSDADRMNGVNFIKDLCNKEEPVKKTVHIVGHWIGKAPQDFYTPEMGKSITQLDKEVDNIKSTNPEDCISDDDCCESYNGYDMKKIESDPSEEKEEKDEDNDFDEEEDKDSEDENKSDEDDDDETDEEESDMDDDMDNDDSDSDDSDDDTDDEDFDVDDDIPDVEDSDDEDDNVEEYYTTLEQFDDNTSSVPKGLYTNKPIQNNDVDPTMNYPHANRMVEETDETIGGTEVTQPDGSVNTVNMPLSAQTKTMIANKTANVKQECGDNKCINQECGDSKLLKQECGDNECIKQEGFFTKKPKKLKPIPRDIIPYITVSMNDIHDANDQAMLSGYTCSKIELVDFYITVLDTQDARYIVPHNRPYLEMMKRELERLLSEILKIRPINRSDQIWRVNYPT